MAEPPNCVDGATVLFWTPLDERHTRTGRGRLFADGVEQTEFSGLAIARYEKNGIEKSETYLFYCDADWEVLNDSLYDSIDDAREQAEVQFRGTSNSWIKK